MTALSRILGVTGALFLLSAACGPQVVNQRSETGGPLASSTGGSGNASGATFAFAEAKKLMDTSCNGAGCHTSPATVAANIPLDTYADVKKYFDVSIASHEAGRMPKPGFPKWTPDEIAKLKAWKTSGFPEVAAPAGGTPPSAKLSFAKDIAPIVKTGCAGAGCHSGAAPAGGIPLTTKEEVVNYYDLSLEDLNVVPTPKMPIPATLWTPADVQKFKDWGTAKFPD